MYKNMKIAILYICTGKYYIFWEIFYNSAQKNLFPYETKHFFVFSDASRSLFLNNDVTHIYQPKLGWPNDTLFRFHMFSRIIDKLAEYDFIFFFNANILFLEKINIDILPTKEEGLLVVQHPGYYSSNISDYPYERNKKSTAYIARNEGKHYVFGAVNGGTSQAYIKMIQDLKKSIDIDTWNGIVATWHDESHLNKYILEKNYKLLSPEYAYPEDWILPFPKKIIILDKNKYGGHNFLREDSTSTKTSLIRNIFHRITKKIHHL